MSRQFYYILFALLLCTTPLLANVGVTDYTGSSGTLDKAVVIVAGFMLMVLNLCYIIASILSIYSATTIYMKMQLGEDGVKKSILILVGACIFILIATTVFPAFFGWSKETNDFKF